MRKLTNPTGLQAISYLTSMPVLIAPNLKKTKVQIDVHGNEVKPFTHEVIKPAEQEYVPTREEREAAAARTGGDKPLSAEEKAAIVAGEQPEPKKRGRKTTTVAEGSPIKTAVQKAIQNQVQKAVQEALGQIDLGSMIEETIKDAFK